MFNEVTYKDDIVSQLRRAALFSMIKGNREMLEKAANEIENLRKQITKEEDQGTIKSADSSTQGVS